MVLSPMKKIFEKNLSITAKSERSQSTEGEHDFMYFQRNFAINVPCKSQIIYEMLVIKDCIAFQPMQLLSQFYGNQYKMMRLNGIAI